MAKLHALVVLGTRPEAIKLAPSRILDGDAKLRDAVRNLYGDGRAAQRVADAVRRRFSPA
ncbi:MAG TPA: hypothetical protein VNH11_36155 [Pirellulales bacterium]|nr:hypothetical protein [Pirellulales bacterium]